MVSYNPTCLTLFPSLLPDTQACGCTTSVFFKHLVQEMLLAFRQTNSVFVCLTYHGIIVLVIYVIFKLHIECERVHVSAGTQVPQFYSPLALSHFL
jgi:hypothetical protein